MRKIILANGVEYEITNCGAAEGVLWIGIPVNRIGFVEAATVFSDPATTSRIVSTYDFDGMETVFEGYTELVHINADIYDGILRVALRKGSETD